MRNKRSWQLSLCNRTGLSPSVWLELFNERAVEDRSENASKKPSVFGRRPLAAVERRSFARASLPSASDISNVVHHTDHVGVASESAANLLAPSLEATQLLGSQNTSRNSGEACSTGGQDITVSRLDFHVLSGLAIIVRSKLQLVPMHVNGCNNPMHESGCKS